MKDTGSSARAMDEAMERCTESCGLRVISWDVMRVVLALCLALLLLSMPAKGDGGMIRGRDSQGAFIVTLFTSSEASTSSPVDVTVLVQSRESGDVILDAAVTFSFSALSGEVASAPSGFCGPMNNVVVLSAADALGRSPEITATHDAVANKLLYGANVILPTVGDWQVYVSVRRNAEYASLTCVFPVDAPPRRLAGLWPYLAIPPFGIFLFLMNLWLRNRSTATTVHARSRPIPPEKYDIFFTS